MSRRLDALQSLRASLFSPMIDPEQMYDGPIPAGARQAYEASKKAPSDAEVIAAAEHALDWHKRGAVEVAAEIAERRARKNGNQILLAEAVLRVAYHQTEITRLELDLGELSAPVLMAAE